MNNALNIWAPNREQLLMVIGRAQGNAAQRIKKFYDYSNVWHSTLKAFAESLFWYDGDFYGKGEVYLNTLNATTVLAESFALACLRKDNEMELSLLERQTYMELRWRFKPMCKQLLQDEYLKKTFWYEAACMRGPGSHWRRCKRLEAGFDYFFNEMLYTDTCRNEIVGELGKVLDELRIAA